MHIDDISLLYCVIKKKTSRLHVAVHLISNRSQKTSKCGKVSGTLNIAL